MQPATSGIHAARRPDAAALKSDHLVNDVWCRFASKRLNWTVPCVVARAPVLVHADHPTNGTGRANPPLTKAEQRELVAPYYVPWPKRVRIKPRCFAEAAVLGMRAAGAGSARHP